VLKCAVVTLVSLVHCYERSRSAEVCCGQLSVLGSLPMGVHVRLEYAVVTLVFFVHCYERSRSAEMSCGHLSVLGSLL